MACGGAQAEGCHSEKTGVLYLPVAVDHKNGMRGIASKTIDAAP